MNPLPSKKLIPKTAQDLELPEELVTAITEFYWKAVHDKLCTLSILNLMIPGLGTFRIKHWKLRPSIEKLKRCRKDDVIPNTFREMGRYNSITTQINKLLILEQYQIEEKKKKEQIKAIRNGKLPNKDLEKQR